MLNFPCLYKLHYNRDQWCECYIVWQESLSSITGADVPTVSFRKLMKFNLVGAVGAKHVENPTIFDREPNYGLNHLISDS